MKSLRVIVGFLGVSTFLGSLYDRGNARSRDDSPEVYPVLAYGNVWGIAERLYAPKAIHDPTTGKITESEEPTAAAKLFESMKIPIPTGFPLPEEKDAHFRSQYGPTVMLDGSEFRKLRRPAELIRARFPSRPFAFQVVTTNGSFVTPITQVFVQETDGCEGIEETVVLYAFATLDRKGEPLFAVPVTKGAEPPVKESVQLPSAPATKKSPHSYVLAEEAFQGKILLQGAHLSVKAATGQVIFRHDIPAYDKTSDGKSNYYLSPPLPLRDSVFPLFVVYSIPGSVKNRDSWDPEDVGMYLRYLYQLAPGGKLRLIRSVDVDLGGSACD